MWISGRLQKYFPVFGETQCSKALYFVMHGDWISYPEGKYFKHWLVYCTWYILFIYTAEELWEENQGSIALNVNCAANSSVNYRWENKAAHSEKQTVSWEKPTLAIAEDDTSICLPRKSGRGKEREKKFLKVTPLELFYIKDRQQEKTLRLRFMYCSDKNNRVFFFLIFLPAWSPEYETGLLKPQVSQKACFSSFLIHAHWFGMKRFLVASAQSLAHRWQLKRKLSDMPAHIGMLVN